MSGRGFLFGASRVWAATASVTASVSAVRFEHKSIAVLGAAVVALYAVALNDPAEQPVIANGGLNDIGAVGSGATESFTALIIDEKAHADSRQPDSVASLMDLYQDVDFRLDAVRTGQLTVPRLLVEKMPSDIAMISSPTERKRLFIKLALPLILLSNERIAADRERLIELRDRLDGGAGTEEEQAWLAGLAERYGLETPDIDDLLQRVDVIPPSLALAQGAEESGWGTSRFVREGNAIFGQRTFKTGTGLVPERRDEDATHEVKIFNGLMESVASYMTNLNTHFAYGEFRRVRANLREAGKIDGYRLVGALDRYSERGEAYIKTIRSIIDSNDLGSYDRANLGKPLAFEPKI